jgi:hypothetical protein
MITREVQNTLWTFKVDGQVVTGEGQSHPDTVIIYNKTSGNLTMGEHTVPIGAVLRMVVLPEMEF